MFACPLQMSNESLLELIGGVAHVFVEAVGFRALDTRIESHVGTTSAKNLLLASFEELSSYSFALLAGCDRQRYDVPAAKAMERVITHGVYEPLHGAVLIFADQAYKAGVTTQLINALPDDLWRARITKRGGKDLM